MLKSFFGILMGTLLLTGTAQALSSSASQVKAWDEWTAEGTAVGELPEMDLSDPSLVLIEDYSDQAKLVQAAGGCTVLHITVNENSSPQTLSAECDGVKVLGPVLTSTGKNGRTPNGTFTVYNKIPMAYSAAYNNAPMARMLVFNDCGPSRPNCIGVHATVKKNYKYLGNPASHGCVRLTMENAQILWDYAIASGTVLVTVI